jgi:hypothetical protein
MAVAKSTSAKIKAVERQIEKHKKAKAKKDAAEKEKKTLEAKRKELAKIKGIR